MFASDEYRDTLHNCFLHRRLTASMSEEERSWLCKKMQYPESNIVLYQYRKCNEFTFNDFLKNQITLVHPKYFNDCFEAQPYIDKKQIEKNYCAFDVNKARKYIGIAKVRDFTSDEIQELGGDNTAYVLKILAQKLVEVNMEETYYANFAEIQWRSLQKTFSLLELLGKSKQNETRIACFSESYDSPIMWGHYGDSGKGFCIRRTLPVGLNMSLYTNECDRQCDKSDSCVIDRINEGYNWLFPVIYAHARPDFTDEMEQQMIQIQFQLMGLTTDWSNYDLLAPLKLSCYKSSLWSYEREWRWIHTLCTNDIPDYVPISVGNISGLYLGANVSQEHENMLKEYAAFHKLQDGSNIPIYKMQVGLYSPDYKL